MDHLQLADHLYNILDILFGGIGLIVLERITSSTKKYPFLGKNGKEYQNATWLSILSPPPVVYSLANRRTNSHLKPQNRLQPRYCR